MEDFTAIIKKEKPTLKDVSIQRYASNLIKLCKDLDVPFSLENLTDVDKVMTELDKKAPSTKKAYLNSLIVALKGGMPHDPSIATYQEKRDTLNKDYFDEKAKNQKNDKEEDNMITFEEWDGVINELEGKIVAQDSIENLSSMISGSKRIHLEVEGPAEKVTQRLRKIEGVLRVNQEDTHYIVECAADKDPRSKIMEAIVQGGWSLLSMESMEMSLEDIFLKLTAEEEETGQ